MVSESNILHRKKLERFNQFMILKKLRILRSLTRFFIILVSLTRSLFSEKMLISNRCIQLDQKILDGLYSRHFWLLKVEFLRIIQILICTTYLGTDKLCVQCHSLRGKLVWDTKPTISLIITILHGMVVSVQYFCQSFIFWTKYF